MARIAVVGSRGKAFERSVRKLVKQTVMKLPRPTVVISGGAFGVDYLAARYARYKGLEVVEIRPDYKKYRGEYAPLARNTDIARECDGLIAFWDGKSRGTADVIAKVARIGKPVWVWTPDHAVAASWNGV
jgi:predicted Rossmann-fold nucleotide-binding protein